MEKQIVIILTCFMVTSCQSSKKVQAKIEPVVPETNFACGSAKEFITTYYFLQDNKAFNVDSKSAQAVALKVSAGCDEAAERFIQIVNLLVKAKMDTGSAINIAEEFALKDEIATQAFINVFQFAFLKEYLDMDLMRAIKLARELSIDYKADPKIAEEDFANFVDFCLDKQQVGLPKKKCADLAVRLTKLSEKFKVEIAEPFMEAMTFLRDKNGVNMNTAEALKIAESLMEASPFAVDNFKQVYNFATRDSGLKLNRQEAIDKALAVAKQTTQTKILSR